MKNTTYTYLNILLYIIVKKARTDIQTLDDLNGKTLNLVVGTTPATALEKLNEEHGNEIKLRYSKATNYSDPICDVADGRVDAFVENIINFNNLVKTNKLDAEAVGEPVLMLPTVFIFRKDAQGAELKKKNDEAIDAFKANGTPAALAEHWTGRAEAVK